MGTGAPGELLAPLYTLEESAPPVWERWLPTLRQALGLEHALLYTLKEHEGTLRIDLGVSSGAERGDQRVVQTMDEMMATAHRRWGVYDPRHPECPQQNRAILFPPTEVFRGQLQERQFLAERFGVADEEAAQLAIAGFDHAAAHFRRIGLDTRWQLRTLICDGGELLGWLGSFEQEAPPEAIRAQLEALVPAVRQRLRLERMLGLAPVMKLALDAVLEAIARPAFVVDRCGRVQLANALGRERLSGERTVTRAALADAIQGRATGFEITPIRGAGTPLHYLVLAPARLTRDEELSLAAARWGLTPAERRVLGQLVAGESNKCVARALGCSEKTVEVHVTRLLAKSGTRSRSALVARFWERR